MRFKSYKNNRHFALMPKDIYDIPLNSSWVEENFGLHFELKSNISCQIHPPPENRDVYKITVRNAKEQGKLNT